MAFSTFTEITLQFIKFVYVGGVTLPLIGRVDEVASSNVMSYLALVIGVNVCIEGFCWCAFLLNSEIYCVDQLVLTTVLVVLDIMMDVLYFFCGFLDIQNELPSDSDFYSYLVSFSEDNIFLFITLLLPIYQISAKLSTLNNF